MTDTTKTEALRLASALESFFVSEEVSAHKARQIAAELRRLSAVEAERDRLAAECEALRADAELFRWLESQAYWQDERDMAPGGRWWLTVIVNEGRPSFRDAASAARAIERHHGICKE